MPFQAGESVPERGGPVLLNSGEHYHSDEEKRQHSGQHPTVRQRPMDPMVDEQQARKARGNQPPTPPISLEAAPSSRERVFTLPRTRQKTLPDSGRPAGIPLLLGKQERERSCDIPIVTEQTGALRAGPGMGHDQLEIGAIQYLERGAGEHFLQLVMAERAHKPSSRRDRSCSRSFCMASRIRVFTVPSGWAI